MTQATDGTWFVQTRLQNGDYAYKFVVYTDGSDTPSWLEDPNAEARVTDGVGGFNSQRIVSCSMQVQAAVIPKWRIGKSCHVLCAR